eukprot:7169715-Prymnesium_polylepis.1
MVSQSARVCWAERASACWLFVARHPARGRLGPEKPGPSRDLKGAEQAVSGVWQGVGVNRHARGPPLVMADGR